MKRNFILGLLVVAGFPFFSACDDDDPPPPAMLNFEVAEQEVTESDGTLESIHPAYGIAGTTGREIQVKVILDKPAADVSVVSFSVSGTAQKTSPANPAGDFAIEGNNITIEKGATEAIIEIQLFEDFEFEYDDHNDNNIPFETIVVTLESVVSGPVQLGEQKQHQLDVLEDDALIFLVWDPQDQNGDNTGDVDMDFFLWLEDELWDYSISEDPSDIEYVIILGGFPEGSYSMSYTYYEGTSDDLDFQIQMYGTLNGNSYPYHEATDPLIFNGHYTLANKNTYDRMVETPNVQIVQNMVKSGPAFTDISNLTELTSGSRITQRSLKRIPLADLKRMQEQAKLKYNFKKNALQ